MDGAERHSGAISTIATAVIAIFTVVLAISTALLFGATKSAANAALQTAETTRLQMAHMRPFIGRSFTVTPAMVGDKMSGYKVGVVFKNNGGTPAVNCRLTIGHQEFSGDLPADFAYPLDGDVVPITHGPNDGSFRNVNITIGKAEWIRDRKIRYFIWGQASWRDIFEEDTIYEDDFCVEVKVTAFLANQNPFNFTFYGPYNRFRRYKESN